MIEHHREAFPVCMMCRLLGVSASGYYAWRSRPVSRRGRDNQRLLVRIRRLHADSDGVLDAPRLWRELRHAGEACGRHRVAKLMRLAGLRGIPQGRRRRRQAKTSRPDHVRNHLQRDFAADTPNSKWVTDITYLRTLEG